MFCSDGKSCATSCLAVIASAHTCAHTTLTTTHTQVLLKRLASMSTYSELVYVLGGSKTALSDTFQHMLELLHTKYHKRLSDLTYFEPYMLEFASLTAGMGCPFSNVIGLLDGHFHSTLRPMGPGCVNRNMLDRDVFNGKERLHGLKYQVTCLPRARRGALRAKFGLTTGILPSNEPRLWHCRVGWLCCLDRWLDPRLMLLCSSNQESRTTWL